MNSTVRLSILALTVSFSAVTTSSLALAQRKHTAENGGIRSVNGDVSTSVRFVNRKALLHDSTFTVKRFHALQRL
jgi:hypothetical protein